jgi:hypothetical protein
MEELETTLQAAIETPYPSSCSCLHDWRGTSGKLRTASVRRLTIGGQVACSTPPGFSPAAVEDSQLAKPENLIGLRSLYSTSAWALAHLQVWLEQCLQILHVQRKDRLNYEMYRYLYAFRCVVCSLPIAMANFSKRLLEKGNGISCPRKGNLVIVECTGWVCDVTQPGSRGKM